MDARSHNWLCFRTNVLFLLESLKQKERPPYQGKTAFYTMVAGLTFSQIADLWSYYHR